MPGGIINLKTDSLFLYKYTEALAKANSLEILDSNNDIYGTGRADEKLSIKTHYEEIFLEQGIPITYLAFRLNNNKLVEPQEDSYM